MKIVFILAVIVASASAATCATTLKTKALCNTCTELTHLWTCSTCTECASASKACSAVCKDKGFVTETAKCVKCPDITGCPRENITCQSTGGTATATSAKCSKCSDGYVKFTKSGAADVCASVGISNCKLAGQSCTENAATQACAAATKTCATCEPGYVKFTKSGAADACAQVGISNCELAGQSCTENAATQACAAATKTCKTCKDGYKKVTTANAADQCTDCTGAAACVTGCGAAQLAVAYNDGADKCARCESLGAAYLDQCTPTNCPGYYVGFGECRKLGQQAPGANCDQICSDIPVYQKTGEPGLCRGCTDFTVANGKCDKGCSKTACTKATCASGYTEASGQCTKSSSGGGGSGNNTGGGNTNTSGNKTNSTGGRTVGSVLMTIIVILAVIC